MSDDRYLEREANKLDEYKEVMQILRQYCNDHSTAEQAITIIKTHTGWDRAKVQTILKEMFKD